MVDEPSGAVSSSVMADQEAIRIFGTPRMAPQVLLLDDSEQLRFVFTALISQRFGVTCLALASLAELQARQADALGCRVAILDINLGQGQPSGIDAFRWFQEQQYNGKICFLTGHAVANPLVAETAKTGAQILEKPLSTDVLLAVIDEALSA